MKKDLYYTREDFRISELKRKLIEKTSGEFLGDWDLVEHSVENSKGCIERQIIK